MNFVLIFVIQYILIEALHFALKIFCLRKKRIEIKNCSYIFYPSDYSTKINILNKKKNTFYINQKSELNQLSIVIKIKRRNYKVYGVFVVYSCLVISQNHSLY